MGSAAVSSSAGTARHWLVAGAALLLAALVLTGMAAGERTVPGDLSIGRALQWPASAQLDAFAQLVSDAGDEFPAMAAMALAGVVLLALMGRGDLAIFLAIAAALRALGPVLKVLINSPRPTLEAVVIVAQADGLGFPSGHAFGAALFFGALVMILPQVGRSPMAARMLPALAAIMMLLIAWSRIRLGVHWPSDVAGGLLYGLGLICLLQAGFVRWRPRVRT